jgi:hypothetical protein
MLTMRTFGQVKEFLSTIMLPAASSDATQGTQSTEAAVNDAPSTGPASAPTPKVVLFAHHKTVMNQLQIMLEDHYHVSKQDATGAALQAFPQSMKHSIPSIGLATTACTLIMHTDIACSRGRMEANTARAQSPLRCHMSALMAPPTTVLDRS